MKKMVMMIVAGMMAAMSMEAKTAAAQAAESKTMVVYFSATGTTKAAAQKIAKEQNAVLWEIEPAEKYTAADLDWRNKQSRSSIEMADPSARPTIKQCTNIQPYDTIYVGYPIWWGICPRIIDSWLENNLPQLEGKTLIPFATSGSSGIEQSVDYLRKTYPGLKWEDGKLIK
jgi:putative NADPH-quinone reductase